MSNIQLGLLVQSGVEKVAASTAEEDWVGLSFNTKLDAVNKIKAQYFMVEDNATTSTEGTLIAVGFDHKFSKNTTGYVMYSAFEEETGSVTGDEVSSLSVGMIVKL